MADRSPAGGGEAAAAAAEGRRAGTLMSKAPVVSGSQLAKRVVVDPGRQAVGVGRLVARSLGRS